MKRITTARALAALVVLAGLAVVSTTSKHTVPAVYASPTSPGCNTATLTGNYAGIQPAGFTSQGPTTGSEVPWQFVGVANFDGQGHIETVYTAVVNGVPYFNQTDSGYYTLGPGPNFSECVGTITFTSGNATGYMANIAVVGGGAEVFGIATQPGDTATFDLKKQ